MTARMLPRSSAMIVFIAICLIGGKSEVISDLSAGPSDEARTLELKAEEFWGSILAAAQKAKMGEHAQLYIDTEKVIGDLSNEHAYVKEALTDALSHLRHADDLILVKAMQSTKLASDEMSKPVSGSKQSAFSFMAGGQMCSVFKERLRRFASDGTYSEHLVELVEQRQVEVLPVLQGEFEITGDVLTDCHAASQRSFDALKNGGSRAGRLRGASKVPENAKAVANRIIQAAKETRERFIDFMFQTVLNIVHDAGKHEFHVPKASATVDRASVDVQKKDGARIDTDSKASKLIGV